MERGPIVSEYFRLRDYLNRANKLSNRITKIEFEIEEIRLFEYKFFAVSSGQNEIHKIAVAERTESKIWERTGNTPFAKLEEFCAASLNELEERRGPTNRSRKIPHELRELMTKWISKRLRMLLLNKSYEP
jgi:hypothetical protein